MHKECDNLSLNVYTGNKQYKEREDADMDKILLIAMLPCQPPCVAEPKHEDTFTQGKK